MRRSARQRERKEVKLVRKDVGNVMFCRNLLARKSRARAIGHFDYLYLLNYIVYLMLFYAVRSVKKRKVYMLYLLSAIYCALYTHIMFKPSSQTTKAITR